jgi:hypothetical protein
LPGVSFETILIDNSQAAANLKGLNNSKLALLKEYLRVEH